MDFAELTSLQAEWQSLQPLKPEDNDRLWRKFRLEWNYHSNHIEGNTLTYGETELLLLHDRTTGNHSHREYLEMKAHDVGIAHLRELATDSSRVLTEADIRDLNRLILKEPFFKPAETSEGAPTRKEIIPGQYKTTPNNVRTATGEIFQFASVEDTSPHMRNLVGWLQSAMASFSLHPIEIAAKVHYDFVRIHPFDDGNGRVARLLANYVLLRSDYPPVIVPTKEKSDYLTALRLADAGDISSFTNYLAQRCRWSLDIAIRAAKGDPIDEPSDIEKQVDIFIRHQKGRKNESPETTEFLNLLDTSIIPFLKKIEAKLSQLAPLFQRFSIRTNFGESETNLGSGIPYEKIPSLRPGNTAQISFVFEAYLGECKVPFDFKTLIEISFETSTYTIWHSRLFVASNPYSRFILSDEADVLSAEILDRTFKEIIKQTGRENTA